MIEHRPTHPSALWSRPLEFLRHDDGAITIDWVVLTAALVFMAIGAAFYVGSAVPMVAEKTGEYLSNVEVVPD